MDMFGKLLGRAIDQLAIRRPIFHSEADFQHELAIELRNMIPASEMRLEHPIRIDRIGTLNIDIIVRCHNCWYAIELKYLSRGLEIDYFGETFILKQQGAQDIRRFDVLKDVWCLETAIAQGIRRRGLLDHNHKRLIFLARRSTFRHDRCRIPST